MKKLLYFIIITIINTGLLQAQQETPVVTEPAQKPELTKALRDTIGERLKLARRFSTNSRAANFKLARRHMARVLQLSDSLQLRNADYLAAAGDVEEWAMWCIFFLTVSAYCIDRRWLSRSGCCRNPNADFKFHLLINIIM